MSNHTIIEMICQLTKALRLLGILIGMEVIVMNNERKKAFDKAPKLVQVTMVHSAGVPKSDEETRKLAEKMEQQ